MPKAKWGTGEGALTAADIDSAERTEGFKPYTGPTPPAGLYRFLIRFIKKDVSQAGNDKLVILSVLDGEWQPHHAKYDGAPLWDHLPVMKSTAGRVANFLDAIGATSKDLMNGLIIDEDKKVTKFGAVGDPEGLMVYVNVKRDEGNDGVTRIVTAFNAYQMVDDAEDDGAAADDAADQDGEEPPF